MSLTEVGSIISPIFRGENWDLWKLSNMPKFTEPISEMPVIEK